MFALSLSSGTKFQFSCKKKLITTDGPVQELLQKLMLAEAAVQERKDGMEAKNKHILGEMFDPEGNLSQPVLRSSNPDPGSAKCSSGTNGEMSLKAVKCFNYKKKGHLANPEPRRKNATKQMMPVKYKKNRMTQIHGFIL